MASVYTRGYMRNPYGGGEAQALMWIIGANIALFVLEAVFYNWFRVDYIQQYLALSSNSLGSAYLWTTITYGFLHADFFHILVNMLVIFFMGRVIEPHIGKQSFLKLYFVSVLMGAIFWLLLRTSTQGVLVGASAGSFGLMIFFCLLRPNTPMTFLLFFIVPVTMKPKWIFWGLLGIEIFLYLFYERTGRSSIASSAHLGGFLGGVLMYKYLLNGSMAGVMGDGMEKPDWMKGNPVKKVIRTKYKINFTNKEKLKEQVDGILDKINKQGFGSLTDEEKRILDRAKDVLND